MHGKNKGGSPRTIYVKQVELEQKNRMPEVWERSLLGLYSVYMALIISIEIK